MGEKTAESLTKFVEIIEQIDSNQEVFFRGEAAPFMYRTPSIYRQFDGEVATRSREYFERLFAESGDVDFNSLRPFERLTEVQHFGGLTRFIDITSNALVALFFAVERDGSDGYVYVYKSSETKVDVGDTAYLKAAVNFISSEKVTEFLRNTNNQSFGALTSAIREFDPQGNRVFNREDEVRQTLTHAQIVIATKSNPRIIRQQGAFILPAYEWGDDYDSQVEHIGKSINALGLKELDGTELIIKIPKDKKEKIRRSLANVGLNIGAIYPDIEHQSQVVARYLGDMKVNADVTLSPVEDEKIGPDTTWLESQQSQRSQSGNLAVENVVDSLVRSLHDSPNFNTTHAVIRRMGSYMAGLTEPQVDILLDALEVNEQVYWILGDEDVAKFYAKVLDNLPIDVDQEKKNKYLSVRQRVDEALSELSDDED